MEQRPYILILCPCPHGNEPSVLRVFAEPADLPLDTFARVVAAHEEGDVLPHYIAAKNFESVAS